MSERKQQFSPLLSPDVGSPHSEPKKMRRWPMLLEVATTYIGSRLAITLRLVKDVPHKAMMNTNRRVTRHWSCNTSNFKKTNSMEKRKRGRGRDIFRLGSIKINPEEAKTLTTPVDGRKSYVFTKCSSIVGDTERNQWTDLRRFWTEEENNDWRLIGQTTSTSIRDSVKRALLFHRKIIITKRIGHYWMKTQADKTIAASSSRQKSSNRKTLFTKPGRKSYVAHAEEKVSKRLQRRVLSYKTNRKNEQSLLEKKITHTGQVHTSIRTTDAEESTPVLINLVHRVRKNCDALGQVESPLTH